MRRHAWRLLAAGTLAVGGVVVPVTVSAAGPPTPSLRMMSVLHQTQVERCPQDEGLYIRLGTFMASVNGPFELQVKKTTTGYDVKQVRRNNHGDVTVLRQLPNDPDTNFLTGLGNFFHLTWLDSTGGTVLAEDDANFCPASWEMTRADDSGPTVPSYPQGCGSRLTVGSVWGIDKGWAARALNDSVSDPGMPDGSYTLRIAVADKWVQALRIRGARTTDVAVELTTFDECQGDGPCSAAHRHASTRPTAAGTPAASPGPLPDLIALPAYAPVIVPHRRIHQDWLAFAATAANVGSGPMVVEGFRVDDTPEMPATQYFMEDGQAVGKANVGTLHFDERDGHHHWHFEDFATYELVDATSGASTLSGKQSFCLAPTDPVDLTGRGAEWQPELTGLGSACGGDDSAWIREVLPAGWGDTYIQSAAGQAFDVTTVPNGEYLIRVTVNPAGHLYESDYSNDVSNRRIRLGGTAGHRTVEVVR